ncbi:unnamed protein product [Orchesella dallaii]|uniref:Uncharacterized protein n=1 Tax=Orchesella dallaii TaxID=48710 RepID=A0ABP1Q2V6_9HEXA
MDREGLSVSNWRAPAFEVVKMYLCFTDGFIFSTFSLLKHLDEMDITVVAIFGIWEGICFTSWFVALKLCANIYNVTQRALGSMRRREDWGSQMEKKFMKKFLKSCKPLSIGYGKTYVIRNVSILNFFKFIIRGTARALLTLQDY